MSQFEKVTLLNIGDGPRVVINSANRQVKIDIGEQKSVELDSIIVNQFRRLAARETLRIVDETIDVTPMMRHTIALLRDFNNLPEEKLISEATMILGANAFELRPPRHHLRSLLLAHLKTLLPEELKIGEVLKNDPPAPNPEPEKIVKEVTAKQASEIPAFLPKSADGDATMKGGSPSTGLTKGGKPQPKIKVR